MASKAAGASSVMTHCRDCMLQAWRYLLRVTPRDLLRVTHDSRTMSGLSCGTAAGSVGAGMEGVPHAARMYCT